MNPPQAKTNNIKVPEHLKSAKTLCRRGLRPDPVDEAYSLPPDTVAGLEGWLGWLLASSRP